MYQDDAHDGALCVSRVYPNLLLNVSYPVSAKCLRFLHAANVLGGHAVSFRLRKCEMVWNPFDKRRPEEGTGAQYGPGWLVEKGEGFESFRVFELLQDSDDEERQELGRRAMLRTLAPQTTASIVCKRRRFHSLKHSIRLRLPSC